MNNNRATKEEIYKLFGDLYEMRLEKNTFVTQTQEVAETHSVMMMGMMKMGMMVMQTMAAFMVQIYDGFAPQSYVSAQCSVMHLCAVLSILKILPCSPARTKSEVAINVFLLNMRIALISFFLLSHSINRPALVDHMNTKLCLPYIHVLFLHVMSASHCFFGVLLKLV